MDFIRILRSLEEFLYEAMTWLVFYPRTLWLTVRRPATMMDYADLELGDDEERRYTDTISPPLFLILTVILSHVVEVAVQGQSVLVTRNTGLSRFISDDLTLVLARAVVFSLFPLLMAVRLLRLRGAKLDRDTLRPPFFSQCYIAAPFALAIGLLVLLPYHRVPALLPWMLGAFGVLVAIYLWLQARWFADHLQRGFGRSLLSALNAYLQALTLMLAGALALA